MFYKKEYNLFTFNKLISNPNKNNKITRSYLNLTMTISEYITYNTKLKLPFNLS